ncbi:hypothetical protein CCO03_17155 [Comamonas serinivorans]|uniref:Uncharacterized protein n=1 Tax=Comamonas serinivorans TaxID=1082851 RepID=A0A1Y0ES06_9BURK|nr:hypothetical protein [Comamonas serinivorans]ARU06171.1 hypothetical protein CCO03_17155 [Comamonas serinivorans]
MSTEQQEQITDAMVDDLAQEIRRVDGNHSLGACALAEALMPFLVGRALAAQPQAAQEPVAVYHGRCVIDCGDCGHHDIEMLRMIPKGAKLYTHPAPQAAQAVPQNARDILERCREFIDTAPAYPAGADLADQIDALLAAPSAQDINEQRESTDNWRHLALQFDYHRMQAMSHLRNLLADSVGHREVAEAFVLAGPVSGTDIAHDAARYRALPQAARDVLAERQRQEGGGS